MYNYNLCLIDLQLYKRKIFLCDIIIIICKHMFLSDIIHIIHTKKSLLDFDDKSYFEGLKQGHREGFMFFINIMYK